MTYHINTNNIAEFITRKLTIASGKIDDTRFDTFLGILDDISKLYSNPLDYELYSEKYVVGMMTEYNKNHTGSDNIFDNDALLVLVGQFGLCFNYDAATDASYGVSVINRNAINKTIRTRINSLSMSTKPRKKLELGVLNMLLNFDTANIVQLVPLIQPPFTATALTTEKLYLDPVTKKIGFDKSVLDLDEWAWNLLTELTKMERNKDLSTSLDFDKLFEQVSKTAPVPKLGFTFVNVGGVLHKKHDGTNVLEKYDYDTLLKKKDTIVADFCSAAQLGDNKDNTCTDLLNACDNINDPSKCKQFMDKLGDASFPAKMQGLKLVDPLIITRIITMFKWPTRFDTTDKLYKLQSPREWMNPDKQPDDASKANMKLLNDNKNLVAFFDAIKSTTDAFPAILNKGFEGVGPSTSTFNVNVSASKLGKMGLKPLMHKDKLIVHQSLSSLLQFKNMIQGHYGKLAVKFGMRNLPGINLDAYGIGSQSGGDYQEGSDYQEGGNPVSDVVKTIKKSTGNEDYVHTADALGKLWKLLMDNLSQNHGMDVTAINNEVTGYLGKLNSLQEKTLYAIAYVKVFTDELRRRVALGLNDIPTTFDPANLEKLVNARNALVSKSYSKDMGLIDTLEQLLIKLKANL